MGYHPRIEHSKLSSLSTVRTRNSELWLINNLRLEDSILGYTAKYANRYEVKLYALAIEGNHLHSVAKYPQMNRAAFQRDLNSNVARAIPRYVPTYPGGSLWARRYSSEIVPEEKDIENWFFYTVLQPVQDGLCDRISDAPGYNCFSDAINGVKRKLKVVQWGKYHAAKRWNPEVKVSDFTQWCELSYERLPGYEHVTQSQYRKLMLRKLEERRQLILAQRGKTRATQERLAAQAPGSKPKHTKSSTRHSHRPRVLSVCPKRRAYWKAWYFDIYFKYKESSRRFRAGDFSVAFPPGTYRPPAVTCCPARL